MTRFGTLLLITGIIILCTSRSKGATDYVLSSLQCNPLSCDERTPFPVFQGSVFVSYDATCTGGKVSSISGRAFSQIGVPEACPTPYTPHAQIKTKSTLLMDDFGCVYEVDSIIEIAEVFDASGSLILHEDTSVSCDAGTGPVFIVGNRPC